MAVCGESGDANKNVSNAQRSIRVAALPYCGHFFDLSAARCGEWKDSGWIVGKPEVIPAYRSFIFRVRELRMANCRNIAITLTEGRAALSRVNECKRLITTVTSG
jgi:hypothetical protein